MKRVLKGVLTSLGYRLDGIRYIPGQLLDPTKLRPLEFDDVICRRMFEAGPELNFVQVGVYDGVTCDPLRKYISKCGWRGALVEPQRRAAEKLRELYEGNDRIITLQAALDYKCGSCTLYTVESEAAPAWAGGMASFRRETILKHATLVPGLETMIKEVTVECVTFNEVLELLNCKRLDLLQIDTEGTDAYLLSLFPFDRVLPAIIHWEVKHLTKAEREECLDRLANYGYRFAPSGSENMLAVH